MKAKIILFCLLVLLVACSQTPGNQTLVDTSASTATITKTITLPPTLAPTPIPTFIFNDGPAPINAFKPSETCPNICWMGIHPGTTSASQAVVLLKNSETTKKLEIFGNTIVASSTEFNVVLRFSSGVVESLHLTTASLTLGEMISVLGKPKDVKLNNNCGITTNFRCLYYQIYYPAWNTLIRIEPQDRAGPSSHDIVRVININLLDEWKEPSQPWLGYGHADEYMHNVPLPSPTPYPLR